MTTIADPWRCADCRAGCECLADHASCGGDATKREPYRHHPTVLAEQLDALDVMADQVDRRGRFPGE